MPHRACGPFLLAVLLLAGCGNSSKPSAADNAQLDDASEMLDSAPNTLADIDENALGPAENAPAANASH